MIELDHDRSLEAVYNDPIFMQRLRRLKNLFPKKLMAAKADERLATMPLAPYSGATAWVPIPRMELIGETVEEATLKSLEALKKAKSEFAVSLPTAPERGGLNAKHLRHTEKTIQALDRIGNEQKDYEILVVPVQHFLTHYGLNDRNVGEDLSPVQFGLPPYALALLFAIDRMPENKIIYCTGGRYSLDDNGDFDRVICFYSIGKGAGLNVTHPIKSSDYCGHAVGFDQYP